MPQRLPVAFAITQPSQAHPGPKARESSAAISRAIDEALSAVASPALRDRVLDRATRSAGLASPPVTRAALREFIERPLQNALVDMVGAEPAAMVVAELRAVARRAPSAPPAGSGVRAVAVAPASDQRAAPTRVDIPRVRPSSYPTRVLPVPDQIAILVSPDATLRIRFEAEGYAVVAVSTLHELPDALGARGSEERLVIVDARLGVPANADLRLTDVVPAAATIVVWGSERSARMLGAPAHALRCDPHATEFEVAALLRAPVSPTMPAAAPGAPAGAGAERPEQ